MAEARHRAEAQQEGDQAEAPGNTSTNQMRGTRREAECDGRGVVRGGGEGTGG